MKNALLILIMTLITFIAGNANAGIFKLPIDIIKKVSVAASAFETFEGKTISSKSLIGKASKSTIKEIFELNQVETKNHAIIYPEEIQFAYVTLSKHQQAKLKLKIYDRSPMGEK